MFCRSISWFISIFVAVVIASNYSDPHSITGSDRKVTVSRLRTDSSELKKTAAVDLGALLDAGISAVVVLVTGDTRLVAHRAVLADRSPVLGAMLRNGTLEASSGQLAVPDVEGPVLRQLLAYLYTLQAPQLPIMAPQLLAAADKYGVSGLKAACEQQVASQLSVGNAVATAVLAVRHSCDTLRQAAITFIRDHSHQVKATQGWADVVHGQREEWIAVRQMLADLLAEASTPATGDSGATPATQPPSGHSNLSRTDVVTLPPAAPHPSPTSGDGVSHIRVPAAEDHGNGTAAAAQPHSNHSQTAAAAAATTAPCLAYPPNNPAVIALRNLSTEEKGRRLIQVAKQGAVEELRVLLAAGAVARATDWARWTALHWAAWYGHVQAARCLLGDNSTEVDARDRGQSTPLHRAAARGHATVVQLLAASSANPNARDSFSSTPLHYAALHGHVDVATALLNAGADKSAKDRWEKTPLDYARQQKHQQLIDILR